MDWYNTYIEEGIRHHVKLLRDNGINTISSCAHDMCIDAYYDGGDITAVHKLLFDAGYRNYTITTRWQVVDGNVLANVLSIYFS